MKRQERKEKIDALGGEPCAGVREMLISKASEEDWRGRSQGAMITVSLDRAFGLDGDERTSGCFESGRRQRRLGVVDRIWRGSAAVRGRSSGTCLGVYRDEDGTCDLRRKASDLRF